MEVECTHCGGRMLVEQVGGVVACPHCNTHLEVPSSFATERQSSVLTEAPADAGNATQIGRLVDKPVDSVLQTSLPLEPSDHFPTLQRTDPANSDKSVFAASTPSASGTPMVDAPGENVGTSQDAAAESPDGPSPGEEISTFPAFGETHRPSDIVDMPTFSDSAPAESPAAESPAAESPAAESPAAESPAADAAPAAADFAFPALTTNDTAEQSPTELVDDSASEETAAESDGPPVVADDDPDDASNRWMSTADAIVDDSVPAESSFDFDTATPEIRTPEIRTPEIRTPEDDEEQAPSSAGHIAPMSVEGLLSSEPLDGQKTRPADLPSATPSPPKVSKFLFVLVASYASAATLAIIILIIILLHARQNNLESLPDLKPPIHNGNTAFQLVPEDAPMPPGHTLRLGQSQRFGNLRITPLRVTRGAVEFVYFSDEPGHHRPPTPPTLKLRLRFENVSTDQTFAPLGRKLVLTRIAGGKRSPDQLRANNFVCRTDNKRRDGSQVLLFDLPQDSNWDLRDQDVDHVLKPGEVFETYLASEAEGLKNLTGELIWRVQFRKGYHPKSKRGVTTLIEVRFSSKQIQPDPTS